MFAENKVAKLRRQRQMIGMLLALGMALGLFGVTLRSNEYEHRRLLANSNALAGSVMVRDVVSGAPFGSDSLVAGLTGVTPPPTNRLLRSYLLNNGNPTFYVGVLTVNSGAVNTTIPSPGRNLIAGYDMLRLMHESLVFSATLASTALTHIRTAVVTANDTPNSVGYSFGLMTQAEILFTHAGFAKDAIANNNLTEAKVHAEHALNTLYGAADVRYKDYDGNGFADDPSDGYGILRYTTNLSATVSLAANSTNAPQNVKDRAAQVSITLANIGTTTTAGLWAPVLIASAQEILAASSASAAQNAANQLATAGSRIYNGQDLNDNGQVEPVVNEGGAKTAHQTAQRMADYLPPTGSGITGSVQHRDGSVGPNSDQLAFVLTGLPALNTGETYWAYLVDANKNWRWLGDVGSGASGTINSSKTVTGVNLLGEYQTLHLTVGRLYAEDSLPDNALGHLRTALHQATNTPNSIGYAVGLTSQAEILFTHANFARDAVTSGNLAEAKTHVEHVLNTLHGAASIDYKDYDNNGFEDDPSDGFGVLRYSSNLSATLELAANSADATQNIKDRASQVQTTLANIGVSATTGLWAPILIARGQEVLAANTSSAAQTAASQFATTGSRMYAGQDLNDNGQVEPILNEGGAKTAYRYTQAGADYFPKEQNAPIATATPNATPGATPTVEATPVPGAGDAFEEDDACNVAKTISTEGASQSRSFHDEGDSDWIKFSATANKTYIIEVVNVGSASDAVILLHDACNLSPSATQNNAFGSVVRLEWDATKTGDYFVEIRQFDPSFFGANATYQLSITADSSAPVAPKNLRCVATSTTSVGLQWDKNKERDVQRYRATYRNASSTTSGNREVDGASVSYVEITGLNTGELYFLLVQAIDYSGNISTASGEIQCRATTIVDQTKPNATVQQPAAANVFTTTANAITLSGLAQDAGGNLSQVRVRNITKNVEGHDFSLSGSSADFRVENLALDVGDNTLELTVLDDAGNSTQKTLQTHRLGASPGAVLIVAGHNETFGLQTNIYNAANRAYRIFRSAGFTDANIYYIAPVEQKPDGTVNRVDATASPAAVQNALLTWAKESGRVGPGKPLFVYFMDHGFAEKYCVSGCNDAGKITPADLDGWLREVETSTGVNQINVIIEACESGSFLDRHNGDVANSLSKPGRVIITSTGRDNNAYASAQGAYFSDAFFSCLADSGNLKACYDQGVTAVQAVGVDQTPWLDDNGDGLSSANDGTVAQERVVTRFFSSVRPQITSITLDRQGVNGTLSATVEEGAEALDIVWATVFPPSFQEPGNVTLNLNAPIVRLEPDANQPGRYTFVYTNGFIEDGDYRVVFYAQDRQGINATPKVAGAASLLFLPVVNKN